MPCLSSEISDPDSSPCSPLLRYEPYFSYLVKGALSLLVDEGTEAFSGLPDTCVVSPQGISTPPLGLTTSKNIY